MTNKDLVERATYANAELNVAEKFLCWVGNTRSILDMITDGKIVLKDEQNAQECDATAAKSKDELLAQKVDWEGLRENFFTDCGKDFFKLKYDDQKEVWNWIETNLVQ